MRHQVKTVSGADLANDGLVLLTDILPVVILTGRSQRAPDGEGGLLLSRGPSPQVDALPAFQVDPPNVDAAAVTADLDALAGRGVEGHPLWQLHGAAAACIDGVPPLEGVLHNDNSSDKNACQSGLGVCGASLGVRHGTDI